MMNTLEEKYIHNELTAEELKQLRQEVLQLSDESIDSVTTTCRLIPLTFLLPSTPLRERLFPQRTL